MSKAIARSIDTRDAQLPASYSAAKTALAQCYKVDECKTWADKAAALKSYAKMANDDALHKTAARIQGRAIHRMGELLEEVEAGVNRHVAAARESRGGGAPTSRTAAARDAGLSRDQMHTALRVARVPAAEFEAQIESDDPPTITELARQGTRSKSEAETNAEMAAAHEGVREYMARVMKERPEFPLARQLGSCLDVLVAFCKSNDPASVAHGFMPEKCAAIRADVETVRVWMGPFLDHLEG